MEPLRKPRGRIFRKYMAIFATLACIALAGVCIESYRQSEKDS
jgi:hypothetical protein